MARSGSCILPLGSGWEADVADSAIACNRLPNLFEPVLKLASTMLGPSLGNYDEAAIVALWAREQFQTLTETIEGFSALGHQLLMLVCAPELALRDVVEASLDNIRSHSQFAHESGACSPKVVSSPVTPGQHKRP